MIDIAPGLKLPADLASRAIHAQIAPVEGKALLSKAVTPKRSDKAWEIELAPLKRVEAWKVPRNQTRHDRGFAGIYLQRLKRRGHFAR